MAEAQQIDIEEIAPARVPRKQRGTAVAKAETTAIAAKAATPGPTTDTAAILGMIERIMVDPNASVERANQAFDFYMKVQAEQARKAFDEAVAAAKAEIKPVKRNATGHNEKRYADFSAIAQEIDPILGKHGLSYRFRSQQGDKISVTCRLTHKAGHGEETTLSGPADTSGNKNAIQAIGSTLSYLQRYSLVLMLGLAAAKDDDGKAAGFVGEDGPISEEQLAELIAIADEVGADKAKFCKFAKIDSMADVVKSKFEAAKAALRAKGRAA
jgi:hypothetical protein